LNPYYQVFLLLNHLIEYGLTQCCIQIGEKQIEFSVETGLVEIKDLISPGLELFSINFGVMNFKNKENKKKLAKFREIMVEWNTKKEFTKYENNQTFCNQILENFDEFSLLKFQDTNLSKFFILYIKKRGFI
jgi:hypothetical protein